MNAAAARADNAYPMSVELTYEEVGTWTLTEMRFERHITGRQEPV